MGKLIGFGLIGYGVGMLLTIVVMAIGGLEVMVGLFLPIALKMAPVDEILLAWVEVPLSMAITGKLSNVTTFKEDGILGGGRINFEVIMAGGGYDSAEEPVVPALWIEEDGDLDEVIRYVIKAGPLNIPSIFFWLVALGSLGAMGASILFKFLGKKKSVDGIERAPPATTVQVIALDETAFKE
ncbi:uncharacterized protein LOC110853574 isoform X2 [Folsomia candida]|uniref:uncharacterized protein LOC110853574 isoform X2 n=1 Tax=Folsomia candida TaxID=158441 RepID=UPI001605328C|nr:uncharacterized protein LOC110853574 isoform X2 [Folsomia candida]